MNDVAHCGNCSTECSGPVGAGTICEQGTCKAPCPAGSSVCPAPPYGIPVCCSGSCATGTCSVSAGTSFVASSNAKRLETDDTHLYFVDATDIQRVSFAGGTVETLAAATFEPTDLAVDGAHVYWTSQLGGVVQRVAKTGGTVELISSASSPGDIAEFGSTVYWSELDVGGAVVVMQAAKSGGPATKLADADLLYDLEADADGVYVTQYGYGAIRFFANAGGPEGSLPCPSFPHCEDVEPAGDMIYSFARAELAMGGWGIREVVKSPTSHHAFAANFNMFEALSKLRADTKNDSVYFTTNISAGADWTSVIRKAPKCSSGMSTDVVIQPTYGPGVRDFAIGPQNLYFALANGQIYSSPK